jgi:predicted MPP superfamily phosphohydrolase
MWLFLVIFLSLYCALHVYILLKAKAAFRLGKKTVRLTGLFFLFMVASPIIVRVCENSGLDDFAIFLSYIGFIWMGATFYFLWPSLTTDIYRLIIFILKKVSSRRLKALTLSARAAFVIPVIASAALTSCAYYEALDVQSEHLTVTTEKLPPGIDRLRIAQISDVHVGLMIRDYRLGLILQKVKEAEPDILVSTGDLLDGQLDGVSRFSRYFREIEPKFGKYAVLGNHEYIAGIDRAMEFTNDCGFMLLRGSGVVINDAIALVGVDDPAKGRLNGEKLAPEKVLLERFPRTLFTILLKHRPDVEPKSVGLFDLQLSGHTHGGQIFPFSIATYLYYGGNHTGMLMLQDGSIRYVSRGAGTAGPPLRLLAPPEVTIIDIVRKR